MKKQKSAHQAREETKKSSERGMMMNADGLHSGHGIFTRRVARELQMKQEEVKEDKVEEEKKKDEERKRKKRRPRSRVSKSHLIKLLLG
ncbi:unnamed protein product [Malus baccata var. baccata]